ncbi:MerR family transcriptional regulator [Sphaerisporangium sp. B11E5]|uniref:MerR family transcriptional regulator n=1 Tax=Sphaerisporangium sp. B11E5 TaxID=3153563 RepID=UPI00325D3544
MSDHRDEPSPGDQPDGDSGHGPGGPSYGIGAVARRLGVPAPTLRTWNLRYGIGPSHRSPGGHRRYDPADLRRLEEMSRLIKAGLPPAEAAQAALHAAAPPSTAPITVGLPGAPFRPRPATVTTLTRAVLNMDAATISHILDAALTSHGVPWTWDHLVRPAFAAIVRRQESTGAGIEVEHLFSERLLAALTPLTGRPAAPAHPRIVLLACAEEEQHTLPSYALAATLTTGLHLETRLLGPRTPYGSLSAAVRRLAPATVFIWSQQSSTGDPAPLAALPTLRPPTRIITGGPGWHLRSLPPGVLHADSLADAVTKIHATLA